MAPRQSGLCPGMTAMKPTRANRSPLLDPDSFPILLPHVTCLEDDVYVGNRHIARLHPHQSAFLRSCDGSRTLTEVIRATQVETVYVTQVAGWLLWWPEAVQEVSPFNGSVDRLVICTRPEEAWLGMGGRILLEAQAQRTTVLTCFSPFGGTHYAELFQTPEEFNLACRDEAALAARLAGVDHTVWGIPEHEKRIPAGFAEEHAPGLLKDILRETIECVIEELRPREVFVPGALSYSTDSGFLLSTTLSLVAEGCLQSDLYVYEDSPSVMGQRQVDEFCSLFEDSFLVPREHYVDITDARVKKTSLLDLFRCRINSFQRQEWFQSAQRNALLSSLPEASSAERFWQIQVRGLE